MNDKMRGHVAALFTILVWASTFISLKILLEIFAPLELLITRFTISFLVLFFAYPKRLKLPLKEELQFMLAGLSGVTVYYTLEALALTYTQASNVSVLVAVSPFITAILSHFIFKVELKRSFFIGFLCSFIGIVIISFNGKVNLEVNPKGDILALTAAAGWAVYTIVSTKIFEKDYNLIQGTRRIFLYGILFMIPFTGIMEFNWSIDKFKSWAVLGNLFYLAVISSSLGFITWNYAISKLGPVTTPLYIYLVPVLATTLSFLILKETVTPLAVLGSILVLCGLFISQWANIKAGRRTAREKEKRKRAESDLMP